MKATLILSLLALTTPALASAPPPVVLTNTASFRIAAVATTGTTQGEGGCISAQTIPDYADAGTTSALVQTTTVAGIQWPQRLFMRLIDGGTNDTLTCTAIVLAGYDQWGRAVTERIATIDETGEYSLTVFERVTRVAAIGCGAADGAPTSTDVVTITAPNTYLGLRSKVFDANDIVSMCIVDESDTPDGLACAARSTIATALSRSLACGPRGTERCYTVNLSTSSLFPNATPAANDVLQMQWRQR